MRGALLSIVLHAGGVLGLMALAGGGRSRAPSSASVTELRLGGEAAPAEVAFRPWEPRRLEPDDPVLEVEAEPRKEEAEPPRPFRGDRPPPRPRPPSGAERVPPSGDAAPAEEATVRPTPLAANAPPAYPVLARRLGHEGRVTLRARLTAEGLVEALAVAESSGYASLDQAALEAVRRWRFTAGGETEVTVRFRLTE